MQKVIVSKKAIREMIRESLDMTPESKPPVNVNPEIGPETKPEDENAITAKRTKVKENKMNNVNLVESIIRQKVRKIIRENRSLLEAKRDTPSEYLTVDDDGMKLPDIAKKLKKSVSGVHRDATHGQEKFVKNSWLFATTPADLNLFRVAAKKFLNRLEAKALEEWEKDQTAVTSQALINPEDAMFLIGLDEVLKGIDVFVDYWLPENISNPEDMISEEDLEELRANPAQTVTLPGFYIAFLNEFLDENYEVLDSMRTFSGSQEYQKVFNQLREKYKDLPRGEIMKLVKQVLAQLAKARPD
jgi:hypothetical protein